MSVTMCVQTNKVCETYKEFIIFRNAYSVGYGDTVFIYRINLPDHTSCTFKTIEEARDWVDYWWKHHEEWI